MEPERVPPAYPTLTEPPLPPLPERTRSGGRPIPAEAFNDPPLPFDPPGGGIEPGSVREDGRDTGMAALRGPEKPPWDPSYSEGLVIPPWLREYVVVGPREAEACRAIAVEHDRRYYEGGTEEEREAADAMLRDQTASVLGPHWSAKLYDAAQRFGGEHWGTGRTWDGRRLWQGAIG